MHMQLCRSQAKAGAIRQGARQVGMAAMMILPARQQIMGIGVAAGADDVMYRAAKAVKTIPIKAVISDQRQRAQIGQV